jgi:uncharacterized protein (UPF0276 family)
MEFAVNYSPQAAQLLQDHQITFDRFKCAAWDDMIASARQLRPVYVHFPLRIGMGIGDALNTEKNQPADWRWVESLLAQTDTTFVNVHLAPIVNDFRDLPADTDQPAHIERLLEAAQRDLDSVIRRFGADKVIVENDYYNPGQYFRAACVPDFICTVIESAGCGLLLDISHARLAARALDLDARDYLAALPVDHIREIHLTGIQYFGDEWQNRLRDANISPDLIARFAGTWLDHLPMRDEDWTFYGWAFDQLRSGAWRTPWVASLEYGGVGALWQALTKSDALLADVPRLCTMLDGFVQ